MLKINSFGSVFCVIIFNCVNYRVVYFFYFTHLDHSGRKELVLGFSDRKVRCYRWVEGVEPDLNTTTTLNGRFNLIETWELAGQVNIYLLSFFKC